VTLTGTLSRQADGAMMCYIDYINPAGRVWSDDKVLKIKEDKSGHLEFFY